MGVLKWLCVRTAAKGALPLPLCLCRFAFAASDRNSALWTPYVCPCSRRIQPEMQAGKLDFRHSPVNFNTDFLDLPLVHFWYCCALRNFFWWSSSFTFEMMWHMAARTRPWSKIRSRELLQAASWKRGAMRRVLISQAILLRPLNIADNICQTQHHFKIFQNQKHRALARLSHVASTVKTVTAAIDYMLPMLPMESQLRFLTFSPTTWFGE